MSGSTVQQHITPIKDDTERTILTYATMAQNQLYSQYQIRDQLQYIDRAYMRENDWTAAELKARLANRIGDANKFQNITVPIVMPQVETALGYMINVFLTGYPIFGVSSDSQNEDAALQVETIIAENAQTAKWAREMVLFFRDGLKYNLHAIECDWQQQTVWDVKTDPTAPNGKKPVKALWNGNVLKRMDLYNTFFDPRVHPAEIYIKGEYVGFNEVMSRIQFKKYMNDLFGKIPVNTVERALNSTFANSTNPGGSTPFSFFQPLINPFPTMSRSSNLVFDWTAWALNVKNDNTSIKYSSVYLITKIYMRILPSDFGLPGPEQNTPQVWKVIIINGSVVLYAERQSNAHNHIPVYFGQPLEDGFDYQTKSFATNVQDMQELASAMWNGFIASKRRLIGDRALYDPSRVREKDINDSNPAAKIPVRPSAYGKPVAEAVYAFPYRDEQTNSFLSGATAVTQLANLINGQNPAQQGQFVKGNKTLHEYDDVMGHGNAGNQKMAIMTENQVFTPLKECLILNILQYQPQGIIFNQDQQQDVKIDTSSIRKEAVQFKVSDGLVPTDKLLNGDEFMTALQVIGSSPAIGSAYNMGPLFTYIMKIRGADLTDFEKSPQQVQYEQQLQAWQQAAQMAVQKGAPFSTPMPQPPPPQQPATSPKSGALSATQGQTQPAASTSASPPTAGAQQGGR